MQNKSVSQTFNLIAQAFAPDRKTMVSFIETCFTENEIRGKSILDAGCGLGIASIYFAGKDAAKVIGVDFSPGSVARAKKQAITGNLKNVNFAKADILNLPYEDGFFDIVFTVGALPYIKDTRQALRELTRVLAKGGTILILSLRKTKYDVPLEMLRKFFAYIPFKHTLFCSKVLSRLLRPASPLILGRKEVKGGKTLQQTIMEAFFIPEELRKFNPEEIASCLEKEGVKAHRLIPPSLNFSSSKTVFVLKGKKA